MNALLPLGLLFLTAIALYYPVLSYPFLLDDFPHILENPLVVGSAPLSEIFLQPLYPGNLFRPLTILSYRVEFALFGADPLSFHIVNLSLHLANAALIWGTFKFLMSRELALFAALIFLVLPVHTEAVVLISSRSELLSTFFLLLAFQHLFSRSTGEHSLSVVQISLACFLSFLSKESGLSGGLVLLLSVPLLFPKQWRATSLRVGFGVTLASIAFLLLRFISVGSVLSLEPALVGIENPLVLLSTLERIPFALSLLAEYFGQIFFPFALSTDYSFNQFPLVWNARMTLALCGFLALLAALVISLRENLVTAFFLAWFFLGFALTANVLFPIGTVFADRLLYFPSIGAVAWFVYIHRNARRYCFFFSAFLVFYAALAASYTGRFSSWKALYIQQYESSPNSVKAAVNAALVYHSIGEKERAGRILEDVEQRRPDFLETFYTRALILRSEQRRGKAIESLERILRSMPEHQRAVALLGELHFQEGNLKAAQNFFEALLKLNSQSYKAHRGLLLVALRRVDLVAAQKHRSFLERNFPKDADAKRLSLKMSEIVKAVRKLPNVTSE